MNYIYINMNIRMWLKDAGGKAPRQSRKINGNCNYYYMAPLPLRWLTSRRSDTDLSSVSVSSPTTYVVSITRDGSQGSRHRRLNCTPPPPEPCFSVETCALITRVDWCNTNYDFLPRWYINISRRRTVCVHDILL